MINEWKMMAYKRTLSLEVQCIEPSFLFCVKLKPFCKPDFGESQTIS